MKIINLSSLVLLLFCLLIPRELCAANSDIELLRKQFTEELLDAPVNASQVKDLISTLQKDGTWPGINYEDTTRTGFQHTRHLSNLIQMSRAYKKEGSPLKVNAELKSAFDRALEFWLDNDFICENWWNNEIGTPNNLTAVLLIMDEDLSPDQVKRLSAITGRAHINAWGARQSGDRIKIAGIQAKNALFKRDAALFNELIKVIEGEIRFVPDNQRGLQQDYSFHHRDDRVNNTLTYGLDYANAFAEWAAQVNPTSYRFSEESLHLLIDYYLDGICRMMAFGKFHDPGANNREISRPGKRGNASTIIPERLLQASAYRRAELEKIISIRKEETLPDSSFDTFFWQSEHYVHQRPGYYTSVRMFSTRNRNMEEPYNGEGILNHYRGDGTSYLSRNGQEYYSITPVYDWQMIPGATIMQKPVLPSENQIQKKGAMDFVGAVTNGLYGAVGFDFISPHNPLKARKAWFFFDNEYVCLGAGIQSETSDPVFTTIEQALLEGDVIFSDKAGKQQDLTLGQHFLETPRWIYHNGNGYLFPQSMSVAVSNQSQTGSWFKINRQTTTPKDEIKENVFKLWIDHGALVNNGNYEYIVIPNTEPDKMEEATLNSPVMIIENNPDKQIVYHPGLQIAQMIFYKKGIVELPGGLHFEMVNPGIVMLRMDKGQIREISISDPSRKLEKIDLIVNRKIEFLKAGTILQWNQDKGMTTISIDLPQGYYTGQSVVIPL